MSLRTFLTCFCLMILTLSCGKKTSKEDPRPGTAVIAITSDIDNFNPIVSSEVIASQINSAIFPMILDEEFNIGEGRLTFKPMLAKRWEFQNDGKDVVLHLRGDVKWQDGFPVTAEDIKFSYGLYGNPDVASHRRNYVDNMMQTDGKFDLDKSITIPDDTTIVFHFARAYPEQLFHVNLQPIAKHIFRNVDPKTLVSNPANSAPTSGGPFKLLKWTRLQEVILQSNPLCNLPFPGKIDRIILRVITDPATRLAELKKGSIDMMWPIYPENVKEIQDQYPDIRLETLPPRGYDYIGWANIDFQKYHETKGKTIKPHPLFGSKLVRQALTYGINRPAIIDGFLGEYGELAITDFSPLLRWAINDQLKPFPYDPQKARELLRSEGWEDHDGDGIIDKEGRKFEFTLNYNAGNARRAYTATVVQDNLKQLGIKVNLASVEGNLFFANIRKKDYDAFLAGFSVGLAIDPSATWGSDISNPFNNTGFQNKRVDALIKLAHNVRTDREEAPFWKDMQAILHEEQPATFLYWIKEIAGINRRLESAHPNVLGMLDAFWEWSLTSSKGANTY